jgi:hypothetical protein
MIRNKISTLSSFLMSALSLCNSKHVENIILESLNILDKLKEDIQRKVVYIALIAFIIGYITSLLIFVLK